MKELETLVSSYNGQYSKEQIQGAINAFAVDYSDANNNNKASIFSDENIVETGLSIDQFNQAIADVRGENSSNTRANSEIIFDIYDKDDDGYLSKEELGNLDQGKKDEIIINKKSLFFAFKNVDIIAVEADAADDAEADAADDAEADAADKADETDLGENGTSGTTTPSTEITTPTTGTTTPTTTTSAQEIPDVIDDTKETETQADISKYVDDIKAQTTISPEEYIKNLYNKGTITEEQADALRKEFTIYSTNDEKIISEVYNMLKNSDPDGNVTRADAIKYCEDNNKLSEKGPVAIPETYWDVFGPQNKDGLSDEKIRNQADTLYAAMGGSIGTDEEAIKNFLETENISDEDKIKIIKYFDEHYGSFLNMGYSELSGFSSFKQDDFAKEYADLLMRTALQEIELAEKRNGPTDISALTLLCSEFYMGTAGRKGTANRFIHEIMNKGDEYDKVLAEMSENFSTIIESVQGVQGSSMEKCIRDDFSSWAGNAYGDKEDSLLRKLESAKSKYLKD